MASNPATAYMCCLARCSWKAGSTVLNSVLTGGQSLRRTLDRGQNDLPPLLRTKIRPVVILKSDALLRNWFVERVVVNGNEWTGQPHSGRDAVLRLENNHFFEERESCKAGYSAPPLMVL